MLPLWRLVRNRHTRQVYDRLEAAGVTASRMVEYVADISDEADAVDDVTTSSVACTAGPADCERFEDLDLDFSIPVSPLDDEWAVVATADGRAVGRALVSADQRPYVKPLGQRVSFDGAYVRRVYVRAGWRGDGIATRLVGDALDVATGEFGVDEAAALVATDNRPSRWVFETNGFRPVRRHDYVRLFGREFRRTTPLAE